MTPGAVELHAGHTRLLVAFTWEREARVEGSTRRPGRQAMGLEDRRGDNGTTLVEFAMVAPLLLILIFGIVEFARAASELTAVRTAAREGARFATTVGDALGGPHYVDCEAIVAAGRERAVIGSLPQITVEWEGG